ncbi:Branched-chain amino acid transport ATP-binding protein LivF [Paraburkholderia caribensis MBA4]|uniref:Branched-chain amino acid transport ATP-binding protein LivF n=1 Tax=Paraburkholderia caribensis MBA4 TaxID=1323664 RepID=A0A0P0RI51_9BURK|nr:ABC transporter ATP-binding protein [Paraburkholderia caribensis]ALL68403.1 Branched-chain amino acid transport ATP-binding protein LivF [Paraburkholderia caribensis MBA4]
MLEVSDLKVSYGAIEALRGVSFRVEPGQTVAIIGANGAGKSTLMRAISGLVPICGGSITHCDKVTKGKAADAITRSGIVQVPEGRQIFPNLTVEENLRLGGFRLPTSRYRHTLEETLLLFPRLRERLGQLAGLLSGGEQQMLAIARALLAEPKLLLLDEPSMGLAPSIVDEIFKIIGKLKASGMTILVVEQSVKRALDAADYAYVLELGHIVAQGSAAELLRGTDLTQLYLGGAAPNEEKRVVNG